MKKTFYLFSISLFIFSCGGSGESSESHEDGSANDTTAVDSLATDTLAEVLPVRIDINVNKLLGKLDTTFSLPLVIDTAFIDFAENSIVDEESDLTPDEVNYMAFDLVNNRPTNMASFSFNEYTFIDSLHTYDQYDDYMANIDIAMTTQANAKLLGKAPIGPDSYFIIWATDYSTLEACPYGSGTYVWATLFSSDVATNTVLIGESSGGADAPYWGSTFVTGVLKRTSLETHVVDENGGDYDEETDEEIVEHKEEDYKVFITNDFFEAEEDK